MMWVLGITTLFSLNIQNLLLHLESDLLVNAYVRKGADVPQLADTIREMEQVASLRTISPQEARARLADRMGDRSRSLDLLDLIDEIIEENPLPWGFEIRAKSAADVSSLVSYLWAMSDVEDVIYSGMVVERVSAISRVASRAAVVMFILSIMITSLVVYNTIHISLYSRQEEIAIMFLVGATRSYISTPFVLQGTFLAIVGALVAVLGITSVYLPGIRLLQHSLPFLKGLVEDTRTIGNLGMLLTGFGATLGWVCSFIVVSRFMSSATKPL
jgi:cell division transport system permease protein